MALIQNIFKMFVSNQTFEKAKTESQTWYFTCECGKVFNIWEIGGIRYKAKGNPMKMVKCPGCNKTAHRKLQKK
jgi:predicted SprT family Zn-dependent metalloprotease